MTTRVVLTVDARAYGGAEAYVSRLLEHLPDSYACTLLATDPVPRPLAEAARRRGADLLVVPRVHHKADLRGQLVLVQALRAVAPQLVHVNMADTANHRYALGAAALLGQPTIATLHTTTAYQPGFQARLLGLAFRRLKLAIAVSDEIARHLRHRLGLPASKVRTVANGVPPARMVERRRDPSSAVCLAASGRLNHEKGIDLLLEAVAELVRRGRRVELVVAGKGPEQAKLKRRAMGLPVRFAGFLDDIDSFLAAADVLCLPSRREGLPFTLLEGMMSGLPCVATDVGNVSQVLDGAGVVVPPNDVGALTDALDELIQSPERRNALGRAAHERARSRYSVSTMVESTSAVYREALAGA